MPIRSMHPTAFDKLKIAASRYLTNKSDDLLDDFLRAVEDLTDEYDNMRQRSYDLESRIENLERIIEDWKRDLRSARDSFSDM